MIFITQVSEETVEFVLILDRSSSMSGQPWSQVQTAMSKIVEMVKGNQRIRTKIMVYNDSAQFLKSTGEGAAIEVKTIRDYLRISFYRSYFSVFRTSGKIWSLGCVIPLPGFL